MTSPVMTARNLVKTYSHVVALNGADFDLYPGEVLAVIGDNGAGKSTLIKVLSGAIQPDAGSLSIHGAPASFASPLDARAAGIETVYQDLALAPALNIAENLFLGRELRAAGIAGRVFRRLDSNAMHQRARASMDELQLLTVRDTHQLVETLSGGQRQGVAVARAAMFGTSVIFMDEPTAALGVKESSRVLDLIRTLRDRGTAVVVISHNMPQVWDVADRIHIHRLGQRIAVVSPQSHSMTDGVALMTGAAPA